MNMIKIDTRHMTDLWKVPVIKSAYKSADGRTFVVFNDGQRNVRLTDGDEITYDNITGIYDVRLTTESYKFNARLPITTKVK